MEEEYLEKMKKVYDDYTRAESYMDVEDLHWEYDGLILDFLKNNGYTRIAYEFEKIRNKEGFWYA